MIVAATWYLSPGNMRTGFMTCPQGDASLVQAIGTGGHSNSDFIEIQPFSQKSRTPTVAKECQIGLYDPAGADLELFCSSWSAGFLGERL